MRYYLDTEFLEDGRTIMPISIGVVSEDGREFYSEFEFDQKKAEAHDFVREHVLPHLRCDRRPAQDIAADLLSFVGDDPDPQFWAWYGAYDWVLVCQMFGTMIDLPENFPMFIRDLKVVCEDQCVEYDLPCKPSDAHNALADARWLQYAHLHLRISGSIGPSWGLVATEMMKQGAVMMKLAGDDLWRRSAKRSVEAIAMLRGKG